MNDLKEFSAEVDDKIPTLDLHGLYPDEAMDTVEIFLYNISQGNLPSAKIVYGIGRGVLEKEVEKYLMKHPLVEKINKRSGFCLIFLKSF